MRLCIERQKLVVALEDASIQVTGASEDIRSDPQTTCNTIRLLYSPDFFSALAGTPQEPAKTPQYEFQPHEKTALEAPLAYLNNLLSYPTLAAEPHNISPTQIEDVCNDLRAALADRPFPSLVRDASVPAPRQPSCEVEITVADSDQVSLNKKADQIPGAFPDSYIAAPQAEGHFAIPSPALRSPPSRSRKRDKLPYERVSQHLQNRDPGRNGSLASKLGLVMRSQSSTSTLVQYPYQPPDRSTQSSPGRRERKAAYREQAKASGGDGSNATESQLRSPSIDRHSATIGTHGQAAMDNAKKTILDILGPVGKPFHHDLDIDDDVIEGSRMASNSKTPTKTVVTAEDDAVLSFGKLAISDEKASDLGSHGADNQLRFDQQQHVEKIVREKIEAEKRRQAEQRRLLESGGLRPPKETLVAELVGPWRHKIMATLDRGTAVIVQTKSGNPLRAHDFQKVVQPREWLNDEIVNGSLEWLDDYVNSSIGSAPRKCLSLSSFFWPRIKAGQNTDRALRRAGVPNADAFLALETLLVPICESLHWTVVVVRPRNRHMVHIDSMRPGGSPAVLATVRQWLKNICGAKFIDQQWSVVKYQSPLQTNGYDCGAHVITNGVCVAIGINPAEAYQASDMPLQRLRIAGMLLNRGFTGDFQLSKL